MNKLHFDNFFFRIATLIVVLFCALNTMGARRVPHVAIMLPFDAAGIEGKRSVEFTRGFLMAAEIMKSEGRDVVIDLYNEPGSRSEVETTLTGIDTKGTDLLIGGVYPSHFASISQFSSKHELMTAIPFSSRIQQIDTNPFLIALNAPETYRQDCAANLIGKAFGKKGNLVMVQSEKGGESEFVRAVSRKVSDLGYTTERVLLNFDTEGLKRVLKVGKQNLIIVDDSSIGVMLSLMNRLKTFRVKYPGYSLAVIGYAEWLACKEQAIFHEQNTFIVTPSFYNRFSTETLNLESLYKSNFGMLPEDATPKMFLLGYDFGLYTLTRLTDTKDIVTSKCSTPYYQTEFRFERPVTGAGYVNTCVFMLHYKPDRGIDKIGLK